jgi:glycosyltransferase involved in cell wall biosynthesis
LRQINRGQEAHGTGEGTLVDNAVRVLLPVCNAQRQLETAVVEILDVLPEWTRQFELWLLDDGSTDETVELAYGLVARYPQVRVVRNSRRLGLDEALAGTLARTRADFVLFSGALYGLQPDDLQTLWQLREYQRKQADQHNVPAAALQNRMNQWPRIRAGHEQAFQFIGRKAVEQFRAAQVLGSLRRIDRPAVTATQTSAQKPNFMEARPAVPRKQSK